MSFVDRVAGRLTGPLRTAWDLATRTVRDSSEDRVIGLGAEAAFFALLSLPPLLLVLVGTLAAVVQDPGTVTEVKGFILRFANRFVSDDTMVTVESFADGIFRRGSGSVISIGLVTGLWAASRATHVYLDAVRIAYDLHDERPAWLRRFIALGFTLTGIVAGALLLPAFVLGDTIIATLSPTALDGAARTLVDVLYWPVAGLVALALLTTFFHVAVPQRTPWRRDVPGALLALLLWLGGSAALRLYVAFTIRSDSAVYGPLTAPLVLLVWLYVTAMAVLLGAELNAEIEKMWPTAVRTEDRAREPVEHPAATTS